MPTTTIPVDLITTEDLTTGVVGGTGTFDILMATASAHLSVEWEAGRIAGNQYAEVYLGQMTQVLSQSIQFLLSQEATNLSNQFAALQLEIANQDLIMKAKQLEMMDKELEIKDKQLVQMEQQIQMGEKQLAMMDQDAVIKDKQIEQMDLQSAQITAQTQLTSNQAAKVLVDTELTTANIANAEKQLEVSTAQIAKITADTELTGKQDALITQQTKTEQAKILDTVDGVVVAGVVGKQKDVYTAQTKGFKDSALQAATKTMIDTWSVRRTTDDTLPPYNATKLFDDNIGNAVTAMFTNLDISLTAEATPPTGGTPPPPEEA